MIARTKHRDEGSGIRGQGSVVWLERDLRLADNPALRRAAERGGAVVPVFVWSPEEEGRWAPGGASRWWLHQSLRRLAASLAAAGSRLIVRRGPAAEALEAVAKETGAQTVVWNRRYEPAARARESEVERKLRAGGIETESLPGNVLFEPGTILTGGGKPFQVFTAFWKACLAAAAPARPAPGPRRLEAPDEWPASLEIGELGLEPEVDWAGGLRESWLPGEEGAASALREFAEGRVAEYGTERDRPACRGTSRLSPHLHFGEISARQVWHAAGLRLGADAFLRELGWREFSHHLLYHFPRTPEEPLRPEFQRFPWRMDEKAWKAWTRGRTGYPMVDAGMRELWRTGWMHNRVRMIAASFLVKHLLIPWQRGAAWFWDTLVDADLANNTMGWQWTAGCGADAAPFFRVFNPVTQGERFDPAGDYVRRWVPELAGVPAKWIHRPWEAPGLGETYPRPLVDHAAARERALAAWRKARSYRSSIWTRSVR